jgi:hypothetical protein
MHQVTIRACPVCPVRRAVARRVADELGRREGVRVEVVGGGLGELSVSVDGRRAFASRGILIAPGAERILRQVDVLLSRRSSAETTRPT